VLGNNRFAEFNLKFNRLKLKKNSLMELLAEWRWQMKIE
jgi:hypothetical protein